MKTKTLLFSAAALLAVSNVNAQTDITPERFVFSNQELGEYKIDYFNKGGNTPVNWQMAIDQSDEGLFVVAGAPGKLDPSEEIPTTNMGQSIQKLTTIVDLGGEIGKVLCMKGQSSNYENGAENIPGADIGWFNYNFYLPKSQTPVSAPVRIRLVFNCFHNDAENAGTLFKMYSSSNQNNAVPDPNKGPVYENFLPKDFLKNGEYDPTKWEVFEFDVQVAKAGNPARLKMEVQNGVWANGTILIKEIKFIANPEGEPVQGEFVTYDSGTSNVSETILDQSAYSVNGNNVTFLQAGEIFGLNGIKVATAKAGETVQLNAGFYIVRTNGQAAKLVIR